MEDLEAKLENVIVEERGEANNEKTESDVNKCVNFEKQLVSLSLIVCTENKSMYYNLNISELLCIQINNTCTTVKLLFY